MRWVDAWNEVCDIVRGRRGVPCLLPDGLIVGVEECLGWLQEAVYAGDSLRVEAGWVGHRRGVVVHQS